MVLVCLSYCSVVRYLGDQEAKSLHDTCIHRVFTILVATMAKKSQNSSSYRKFTDETRHSINHRKYHCRTPSRRYTKYIQQYEVTHRSNMSPPNPPIALHTNSPKPPHPAHHHIESSRITQYEPTSSHPQHDYETCVLEPLEQSSQ
jgi:hypothetical protein